jgi:hypothetical protein
MGVRILWPLAALILAAVFGVCADRALADSTQTTHAPLSQNISSQAPQELLVDGKIIGKQVAPRQGEVCLVCNKPMDRRGATYLVAGQRIAVHGVGCYEKLLEQPWRYLALIRPHGAFLGSGSEGQVLSWVWFLVGVYFLIGLFFGALCAHRALHTGQSPFLWFGVGFALNGLGYLLLLTRPKREILAPDGVPKGLRKLAATYGPALCPACGKMNHPSASHCGSCGRELRPAVTSEVAKVGLYRS